MVGAAGKSINVAKVLKALSASPLATGFLGNDRGEFIVRVLASKKIAADFVTVSAPTRQCVTIIDESTRANRVTELVEESRPVTARDYERLLVIVRRQVGKCRAVVMSGSLTPGGPVDFYRRCTELAHEAGALSILDAQGPALAEALKAGPGVIKPNRAELAATVGQELKDERSVLEAMRELCLRGARHVVVTGGTRPAIAFDGHSAWRIHSAPIAAVNPIGSGDAFTAGLVLGLLRGEDLGHACCLAAAAGAANALTLMPGELRRADVSRLTSAVKLERTGTPRLSGVA